MRIKKINFHTSKDKPETLPFLAEFIDFFETKNEFDNRKYNLSLILGENGTQKTTILNLITDLLNNKLISNSKFKNIDFSVSLNNGDKDETFFSNHIYKTDFECHYLTTSILNKVTDKITSNVEFIENTSRILVELLIKNNSLIKTLKLIEYPILELFDKESIYIECIGYTTINELKLNDKSRKKVMDISDETLLQLIRTADSLYLDVNKHGSKIDVINSIIYSLNSLIRKFSIKVNRYDIQKNYKALPFNFFVDFNPLFQILDSLDIPDIYLLSTRRRFGDLRYVKEVWFPLDSKKMIPISQLSSGEISYLSHILELNRVKEKKNSIILIDEPELHLHPRWIALYISILDTLFKDSNSHVIVATHSPILVNQIFEENLVLLKRKNNYTKQIFINKNPFGMRIDDILNEVFYLNNNDKILENYKAKLIEKIKNENSRLTAIEEYNSLEDSLLKFDIFRSCYKEIKESRG